MGAPKIAIAHAGVMDGDGYVFTAEALRQAAALSPYLEYDERTGTLYSSLLSLSRAAKTMGQFIEFMYISGYNDASVSGTCPPTPEDLEIEEAVIEEIRRRRDLGRDKYKKTMEREDLGSLQWAQHALEESLDHSVYLKKFMREHRRRLEILKTLLDDCADRMLDRLDASDEPTPPIVCDIRAAIQEIDEELNGRKAEKQ